MTNNLHLDLYWSCEHMRVAVTMMLYLGVAHSIHLYSLVLVLRVFTSKLGLLGTLAGVLVVVHIFFFYYTNQQFFGHSISLVCCWCLLTVDNDIFIAVKTVRNVGNGVLTLQISQNFPLARAFFTTFQLFCVDLGHFFPNSGVF